jgi:anti-anti-sigma regulatory factor
MRWRKTRAHSATAVEEPFVLAVSEPVTRETAAAIVARAGRLVAGHRLVIDLTAIPEFDSEGAAALLALQESVGVDQLTIVGFRQAAARIIGSDDLGSGAPPAQASAAWVVGRLRAIAVVQTTGDRPVTTDGLEPALMSAIEEAVGIVVVDLRGARLTRQGVQTIAFASSTAAVRGQELLVVNVDTQTGERLRRAGLSATTFLAPEPL